MANFYHITTYKTAAGQIEEIIWTTAARADMLAKLKAKGAAVLKGVRMTAESFPMVLAETQDGYAVKEGEATVVTTQEGKQWVCFSPEAVEFCKMMEAA